MQKIKKIVTIGGGSGQYVLLSGLRDLENIDITAIVAMTDSGGSTGRLRDEYGILPPGDIMKCLLALSPYRDTDRRLLLKRFQSNKRLQGHSVGNLLLMILSQKAGSFPEGVEAFGEMIETRGRVLPITTDKATLVAELSNGEMLYGEAAIDVPRGQREEKITKTFLVPHHHEKIRVYSPVIEAIREADYLIIGPGDLYTSIIPNLLVPEVAEEIQRSKAKIVYIANIMTKYGETYGYDLERFKEEIEKNVLRPLDIILVNNTMIEKEVSDKYLTQKAGVVSWDKIDDITKQKIIFSDLLSVKGGIIRHDAEKLAKEIGKLFL